MHIWYLSSFQAQSFSNPWNFLSVESKEGVFCYVNEVTFGKQLSLRAGCQWSQLCDEKVGTFSPNCLTTGGQ